MKETISLRGAVLGFALGVVSAGCAPAPEPQMPGGTGGSSVSGTGGARAGSGGSPASGGQGGSAPAGSGGKAAGTGGSPAGSGGQPAGTGGTPAGTGGTPSDAGPPGTGGSTPVVDAGASVGNFSFFVVSMKALQTLSGKPEGFGGDLRFGQADGLAGADEICKRAADMALPGAGAKTWRALLSATKGGPNGGPVHARDRIGKGPWYDRKGQLFAKDLTELFSATRPPATPALSNDITNERGEPNNFVGASGYTPGREVDNHDTLTGTNASGMLNSPNEVQTCNDWTSTTAAGRPMIGHSWPRSPSSGRHWLADHTVPGCAPGVDRTLGGSGSGGCVGCSGGYGGFYCFAAD